MLSDEPLLTNTWPPVDSSLVPATTCTLLPVPTAVPETTLMLPEREVADMPVDICTPPLLVEAVPDK